MASITDLLGQTITLLAGAATNSKEILIMTQDGFSYRIFTPDDGVGVEVSAPKGAPIVGSKIRTAIWSEFEADPGESHLARARIFLATDNGSVTIKFWRKSHGLNPEGAGPTGVLLQDITLDDSPKTAPPKPDGR